MIEHLENWNQAGRPDFGCYTHRFSPGSAPPGEGTWTIQRPYFRQETTLTG